MNPVQTPINRESITITLTPEEQDLLLHCIDSVIYSLSISTACNVVQMRNKLNYLMPNSGDACRHPVQSPDAVGQGGNQ